MMQDWAGWLLLLFNFSIVLMWKHVRSDIKVVHTIWFCIFLHYVVALLNAYVGTIIGAGGDAAVFHLAGVKLAALPELMWFSGIGSGSVTYANFLGLFYQFFGASLILGEGLSVLAFTLSCIVLVRLVSLLDLGRFRVGIILLFGLLPSAVIFRSVTLRESWQALFFLLSVYWAVRLWKRPRILIFSFMLMSVYCMAIQHNGLKWYAVGFILTSIYWGTSGSKGNVRLTRIAHLMFAGLLVACVATLALKMGWLKTLGQGLKEAEAFRQEAATIHGRATYGVVLDTSSVYGLVKTIPVIFAQYMFAPFPWQIGNVKDVWALLESMLRFLLLYFAVYSWHGSSGKVRSYYSFLLIFFLGMELIWALGTINWGTATRHHVPGYSVIVLLGTPGLILFMRRLHFGIFGCRKDNTMLPK